MPCFYLNPKQDNYNKISELQVCITEALYDVDSIVADPIFKEKGPQGGGPSELCGRTSL